MLAALRQKMRSGLSPVRKTLAQPGSNFRGNEHMREHLPQNLESFKIGFISMTQRCRGAVNDEWLATGAYTAFVRVVDDQTVTVGPQR
jgi:hypothetical protein